MKTFFSKKLITPLVALLLIAVSIFGTLLVVWNIPSETAQTIPITADMDPYESAVRDAMTVEPDEFLPVVALTPDSAYVRVNNDNKFLMLTLHRYPDSYVTGSEVTLAYGDVWVFLESEMMEWYKENGSDVTDWQTRLKALLGMPPENEYTHITALWVDPANITRPAYEPDITKSAVVSDTLPENTDEVFRTWFNDNIIYSYYDASYPWTRLGYTYDWAADGDTEYGLSEFVVAENAVTHVEFTMTVTEFIDYIKAQV